MCRQPNLHELARKFDARNLCKFLAQVSWLCVTIICVCLLAGSPLSLQGCCRIAIRRHVGRWRLNAVGGLPIPTQLSAYLNFCEIWLPQLPEMSDFIVVLFQLCCKLPSCAFIVVFLKLLIVNCIVLYRCIFSNVNCNCRCLASQKIQKKEWIWNKINCLSVSLIHKTSRSDMEAMQFVCSWCQIPGIALLYRLNTETYMCPIKSYIFIWCRIFFWPVSYKICQCSGMTDCV